MNKVISLYGRMGEKNMDTIWSNVKFNPYERPKYTKYEIAKMVKQKRHHYGLTIAEFASKYNVDSGLVEDIERAERSFNIRIYRVCSKILNMSLSELLKIDKEDPLCINYRKKDNCSDKSTAESVELANYIFNEMVMQHKINSF